MHRRRPSSGQKAASSTFKTTPVRLLCLKNLADMFEKEGNDARAMELHVAAAEEDETDLAVRHTGGGVAFAWRRGWPS